eukprot:873900-Amphidinium_carterae.1
MLLKGVGNIRIGFLCSFQTERVDFGHATKEVIRQGVGCTWAARHCVGGSEARDRIAKVVRSQSVSIEPSLSQISQDVHQSTQRESDSDMRLSSMVSQTGSNLSKIKR